MLWLLMWVATFLELVMVIRLLVRAFFGLDAW